MIQLMVVQEVYRLPCPLSLPCCSCFFNADEGSRPIPQRDPCLRARGSKTPARLVPAAPANATHYDCASHLCVRRRNTVGPTQASADDVG